VHPNVVGTVGRAGQFGGRPAGWETRETADWEVCGTKIRPQRREAPGATSGWNFYLTDREHDSKLCTVLGGRRRPGCFGGRPEAVRLVFDIGAKAKAEIAKAEKAEMRKAGAESDLAEGR
jgi:hypothetical protein